MWDRNARYHEWLLPYLEGGLDEARRAQLEARLGEDPALAAEAERLRRTLGGLRGAAGRTPPPENAQVPADLWPHLRARLVLHPAPRPRAPRAWWVAGLGAPAAALIVAALWLPGWHTPDMPPLSQTPPVSSQRPTRAPGVPVPALKPLPAAKPKATVSKLSPPAPAVPRPTPFDLPVPAPPANHSVNGSLSVSGSRTPPAVSAPPARPAVPATLPPAQTGAAAHRAASVPAPLPPAPSPTLAAPKPMPSPPSAPTAAATDEGGNRPAPAPNRATAPVGMSGGAPGAVSGASPKETVNGLDGNARQPAKSSPKVLNLPPAALFGQVGQPPRGTRRNKTSQRRAGGAPEGALQAFGADAQAGLDSWQTALSAAVQPPHWGETDGEQQAGQALMAAREAGLLDDLRARLEARRTQAPQDVVTGRMLAAVYDFGGSPEAALRERRRIAGLEGAGGEDWYALAHAEESAGNGAAARAAYRRALESPIPPSPFHAAIARGRS